MKGKTERTRRSVVPTTMPGRVRAASGAVTVAAPKQRMPRLERERHILQEAVKFFAEVGFGGDTRELARRADVTHALLFRYFPSKEALVERVYQEVYLGRWNPLWESLIQDRTVPLRSRMREFYRLYAQTILSYEWVRLFMFAGLKGADIHRRFFALVTDRIVKPLCAEIRHEFGLPDATVVPLTPTEIELVWGLNSRIFYFGVRKYIYGMPVPDNLEALIEAEVAIFFDGVKATLSPMLVPDVAEARRRIGPVGATGRTAARRKPAR